MKLYIDVLIEFVTIAFDRAKGDAHIEMFFHTHNLNLHRKGKCKCVWVQIRWQTSGTQCPVLRLWLTGT